MSLLKNRSVQASQLKEHTFEHIYAKARLTLKGLMKRLLLKKQFYIIDRQYKLAENEKQTSENLIKILARCQKMFDAQTEIAKIINLIETRQEKLQELKLEMSQDQPDGAAMTKLYAELVRRSARIHTEIRVIKQLEKTLTRPFVFNGNMYPDPKTKNKNIN